MQRGLLRRRLPGAAVPAYAGSLLHIPIKIMVFSRTLRSRTSQFPLQKNCCVLAIRDFVGGIHGP